MSATWLPTMPPNQRHWSRMCSQSSPMYIGAATQNLIDIGSRPDRLGGVAHVLDHPRGDVDVGELQDEAVAHLAGELERERAVGGDPHLELGAARTTGTAAASRCTRPAASCASSRMTWIDSRSSFSVVGLPFVTRTAESPRPMPQIVRLPYISLSVAKIDAVTVQSRVAGFVTIGPT